MPGGPPRRAEALEALKAKLVARHGSNLAPAIDDAIGSLQGARRIGVEDIDAVERQVAASAREVRRSQLREGSLSARSAGRAIMNRTNGSNVEALQASAWNAKGSSSQAPAPGATSSSAWLEGFVPRLDVPARRQRGSEESADFFDLVCWYDTHRHKSEQKAKKEKATEQAKSYKEELDQQLSQVRQRKEDTFKEAQAVDAERQRKAMAEIEAEEQLREQRKQERQTEMRRQHVREEQQRQAKKQREVERRTAEAAVMQKSLQEEKRKEAEREKKKKVELRKRADEMKDYVKEAQELKERRKLEEDQENRDNFQKYQEYLEKKERERQAALEAVKEKQKAIMASVGKALEDGVSKKAKEDEERMMRALQENEQKHLAAEQEKVRKMDHTRKELLESLAAQREEKDTRVKKEQEASREQATMFRQQAVEELKKNKVKEQNRREKRMHMDEELITQMKDQRNRRSDSFMSPRSGNAIAKQTETRLREMLKEGGVDRPAESASELRRQVLNLVK